MFNTAKRFQKNQDTTKYVSVVVLDEVGLAEDSPNLPLKALHPLLEDGTEGSEHEDEVSMYKIHVCVNTLLVLGAHTPVGYGIVVHTHLLLIQLS